MEEPVKILVVDDEARNLDALESILEEPECQVLRAGDADKALRLLLENDVALIILDIKMPGVSGFELAQLIKGTKRFRETPILFLTAYLIDDGDVLTGYGAGAVDYLTKPVHPEILRHKVAVFVDLFRKTRALARLNETLEGRVQERTAELERSETALREASRQKDVFLATLAHELRNPLAPLQAGLAVLLLQPGRSALVDRTLGAMNRQLLLMVRLIDDLLDVSRITRGNLEVRKTPVDLATVVQRAVETAAPWFSSRDQAVVVEAEGAPLVASVDPTRISQIVANLLNNASKCSPPRSQVRVHVQRRDDAATIRVMDDGAGIPADQLAHIFGMFAKVERPSFGGDDGLGIGLALSRRLAELHGGALTAESEGEGKGAIFTLTLPIGGPMPESSPARDEGQARASRPERSGKAALRVVVVEDNADSAEMMTLWLEGLGHEVMVAQTGPDGVALILKARPDIVLCDIGLPGIDGVEVCKRVSAGVKAPPVMVALTGWGMESDRHRTVQAGFQHHLVKPIEPDELRALLESVRKSRGPAQA